MLNLNEEQNLFQAGYKLIGAIDEAGRGPLAGPVVAACVLISDGCMMKNKELKNIKDSKKLTAKKREELYDVILEEFNEVGIGICDQQTIDKINILQASFLAMKKAISSLKERPDFIILDGGFPIPNFSLKQKNIIKGDAKVFSIAAASIIAKVTRDRIMNEMHEKYPQYGFKEHKGYGTRQHFECLRMYGPCPIHRLSFKPVKNILNNNNNAMK
ncbi:MAG: ribonuclease HII [Patescibacteria group bacterium]